MLSENFRRAGKRQNQREQWAILENEPPFGGWTLHHIVPCAASAFVRFIPHFSTPRSLYSALVSSMPLLRVPVRRVRRIHCQQLEDGEVNTQLAKNFMLCARREMSSSGSSKVG